MARVKQLSAPLRIGNAVIYKLAINIELVEV
jgi:hypothetical protein